MLANRRSHYILLAASAILPLGCGNRSKPIAVEMSSPPTSTSPSSPIPARVEPPPITVTNEAADEFKRVAKENQVPDSCYLRVFLVPGGCCGFIQKLDMDPGTPSTEDHTFESNGIMVVVSKRQLKMHRGAKVDFVDERGKRGFMLTNPNFEGDALKKWLPILTADAPSPPKLTPAQLEERISNYRKMVSEHPDDEVGYYFLGKYLMVDGRHTEAVKALNRALELAPDYGQAHLLLGECWAKLEDKDRAITVLRKGRSAAEKKGDDKTRDAATKALQELGAEVPLNSPGNIKK